MIIKTHSQRITEKIEEYLYFFGIKNKLKKVLIRKRMLNNLRQNNGICKINDLDMIVFLLMSKAIKDLNIELCGTIIKTHIIALTVMKQFNRIKL